LFRGFAKSCENLDTMTVGDAIRALDGAAATAYKAVMKPKEGTMLTVARHLAEFSASIPKPQKGSPRNFEDFGAEALAAGYDILAQTPEMLPVLKQAGVVDAGGEGLLVFLQGAIDAIHKEEQPIISETKEDTANFAALSNISHEDITFTYCTEFFIICAGFEGVREDEFKKYLDGIGDSVVVVCDDEIVKAHVHTDHPGRVLERAMEYGQLDNLKIENMRMQMGEISQNAPAATFAALVTGKEVGYVTVCSGDGFVEIFRELGVDYVIEGGQTMNPSTEDIAHAIDNVPCKTVFVLPNNKNIILAAKQAAFLCEGKEVFVIESESLPQGITAMINCYAPSPAESFELMQASLATVRTGQVTHAVRDSCIDDTEIHQGDFIGLLNGKIILARDSLISAATDLIDMMIENGDEILGIFPGAEANDATTDALMTYITTNHPDCEVDGKIGDQPIYYYIFSAE
ncbi:MAG: DAK2 domain-containing protein, partial [Defluviitaleaceae bacterium]|nr:DAK2 domain-containing protein [Defluviitaleaceae bacterium]